MAEKITVKIRASGAHPDVLTVQDAMRQVLDIFELVSSGPNGAQGVEWKLAHATTNSPLEITGEAVSFEPAVDISVVARVQKNSTMEGLKAVEQGHIPPPEVWGEKRIEIAKKIYQRNLNGIGATVVDFEIGTPINITPAFADRAIKTLDRTRATNELYDLPHARTEIGSIDGTFGNLDSYRNHPAIAVNDRRTKRTVWCLLSEKLQAEFAAKADYEDFWKHSRVVVTGKIRYDENGKIVLLEATDVRKVESRRVSLKQIRDPDFTSGLSVADYLNRLREGTLG